MRFELGNTVRACGGVLVAQDSRPRWGTALLDLRPGTTYLRYHSNVAHGRHVQRLVARLLASAIFLQRSIQTLCIRSITVATDRAVRLEDIAEVRDHLGFSLVPGPIEGGVSAIYHAEWCSEARSNPIGEQHRKTLISRKMLGSSQGIADREQDALWVRRENLEVTSQQLGNDRLDRLKFITKVAVSLLWGGSEDALPLEKVVL